jgi:acylphosphatase
MKKRIHVFYTGMFQGVGFRFTAQDIARDLKLAGWVRNLPNGRVELVAEAEEAVLEEFLSRIKGYFSSYIRNVELQQQESGGEYSDFRIRL